MPFWNKVGERLLDSFLYFIQNDIHIIKLLECLNPLRYSVSSSVAGFTKYIPILMYEHSPSKPFWASPS